MHKELIDYFFEVGLLLSHRVKQSGLLEQVEVTCGIGELIVIAFKGVKEFFKSSTRYI